MTDLPPQDGSRTSVNGTGPGRWLLLVLLSLIAFVAAFGQALPSILLEPTKAALGMSDTAIGLLNGLAITIIAALAAFPIGWLADRVGRVRILLLSVIVWSLFTAGMGTAQNFWQFAIGTIGFNLGDAALLPLIYALLATAYSGRDRAMANAVFVAILLLGGSAIYTAGRYLLQLYEQNTFAGLAPWRLVCLTVAAIGPAVAWPLLYMRRSEAPDAVPQALTEVQPGYLAYLRENGLLIAAYMFAVSLFYTAYFVFLFWSPAILQRGFGLTRSQSNIEFGKAQFIGTVCAVAVTLLLLPHLHRRWGVEAPLRLMLVGCTIAVVPAASLLAVTDASVFLLAAGCIGFAVSVSMMLAPELLQSCAPNRFRSRTIALFPMVMGVMRILQPAFVGGLSSHLGESGTSLMVIIAGLLVATFAMSILGLLLLFRPFIRLAQANLDSSI